MDVQWSSVALPIVIPNACNISLLRSLCAVALLTRISMAYNQHWTTAGASTEILICSSSAGLVNR